MRVIYHLDSNIKDAHGFMQKLFALHAAQGGDGTRCTIGVTGTGLFERYGFASLEDFSKLKWKDFDYQGRKLSEAEFFPLSKEAIKELGEFDRLIMVYADGRHKEKSDANFNTLTGQVRSEVASLYRKFRKQIGENAKINPGEEDLHIYPTDPAKEWNNKLVRAAFCNSSNFLNEMRDLHCKGTGDKFLTDLNDREWVRLAQKIQQKEPVIGQDVHVFVTNDTGEGTGYNLLGNLRDILRKPLMRGEFGRFGYKGIAVNKSGLMQAVWHYCDETIKKLDGCKLHERIHAQEIALLEAARACKQEFKTEYLNLQKDSDAWQLNQVLHQVGEAQRGGPGAPG